MRGPMGPQPVPARRKRLFQLILALASVVFGLALAEVTLRIVIPPRKDFRVWPAGMFHVFHPNPEVLPGLSREPRFTVNSLGLRGPEMGDERELRILAIGGSTTECLMIDDAFAWPLGLAKRLGKTADQRPVWSGSAGLSGMNSGDHVIHARYLVPQLPRVDVVVALVGVNDLSVALGTPDLYKPVPADLPPQDSEVMLRRAFQQVPGPLESSWEYDIPAYRRLALFQLARRIKRARSKDLANYNITDDDQGNGVGRWRTRRQKAASFIDELPDLSVPLATYRKNLETFVDLLRARSIRVLLITQPTLWRADLSEGEAKTLWMGGKGDFMKQDGLSYYTPRALAEGMQKFNETMLSVCRERDVECFDLAARIPKVSSFFYDDCHFGDRASETVADLVSESLKASPPFSAPGAVQPASTTTPR